MPKYKFILFVFCFLCMGFKFNIVPKGIPKGLPKEIKGNYRIIEHDTHKTDWIAYDAKSWKKFGEGLKMFPPVHMYEYYDGKWNHRIINEPIENVYMKELVAIINPKKKLEQYPKEEKQISAHKVKTIIASNLKSKSKFILKLKSLNYKGGILVCGYTYVPGAYALWWSKGNKVYNVNGGAENYIEKFDFTFDLKISEALNKCK